MTPKSYSMRRLILAGLLLVFSASVFSQNTSSKSQQIVKLMDMAGTKKLMDQMMVTMKENYKKNYTDVDPKFWDEFFKEMSADLLNKIVPIYDKHFTEEDIKGMIVFYETPAGKKMIEKLPVIMQESMTVGQQWGTELGEKVLARMKENENKQ